MDESGRNINVLDDRETKSPSPLNFKWNDEDPFASNGARDVMGSDPFMDGHMDGHEGSLGGDDLMEDSPILREASGGGVNASNNDITSLTTNSNDSMESSINNRKRSPPPPTTSGTGTTTSSISSRRKKKPKGMPKRPLSAYNLFFQSQRLKILDESGSAGGRKVGFEELGRVIGKKWKSLGSNDKKIYVKLAEKDNIRYRKEMDAYNEMKTKKQEEADRKLPLIDLEGPTSLIMNGSSSGGALSSRQDNIASPSSPALLSRTQQQSKFLLTESGFSTSISSSPAPKIPTSSYSNEFSRRSSVPASPAAAGTPRQQQNLIGSSFLPNVPDLSQAQFRPQYSALENALQQQRSHPPSPAAVAAARAPPSNLLNMPIPPPPPAVSHPDSFPVPPGMEMTLSQGGRDRKYRVQYSCYSMSRDAAQQYIESLVQGGPPLKNTQPQTG